MFRRSLLLVSLLFVGGCWHAQIHTGLPASPQVIEQPWAHSFIAGLVPPSPMDVSGQCAAGVSRVETRHSFLNIVAHAVTWGIYSPMHLTVVCAASEQDDGQAALFGEELTDEERVGPRVDRLPELPQGSSGSR